jgi:beta-lactam-binding protein with PASTA domain
MALRKRVWIAGKFFVLTGALIATYLVFAAAAMRVAVRMREVVVPDLTGRSVPAATAALTQVGLSVTVEDEPRVDPKVPKGVIAAQDPPKGVPTRRQRSVRVWLSAGPNTITVPRVIGEAERAAQARLQDESVSLSDLAEVRSRDYPSGTVVAQDPPADTEATAVAILVNRGERGASFVMPDLIGTQGERAADVLRARGFRVTVVGDHPYPGVPPGIVLRQHPPAGFQIAPGEPVSVEVSR